MFGTRLRTWMETHIVRSRKKQNRSKEDKKPGSSSKFTDSSASGHIESHSFERQYGKRSPRQNGQDVFEVLPTNIGPPSKASMSFPKGHPGHCAVNNLSSPESAYSTGYSTDGTSPGASVPPEYYINIRTGTHYFHANPAQSELGPDSGSRGVAKDASKVSAQVSQPSSSLVSNGALSPRPGRHKREDESKKKGRQGDPLPLPESSTEEDVADRLARVSLTPAVLVASPKVHSKLLHPMYAGSHRRTESCDETARTSSLDSGDSLPPPLPRGAAYQCTSPFLPGASPRQRNRIRTNPWLSTQNGQAGTKLYNSQGETSSTVGSSSTLSSSGCKQTTTEKARPGLSPRSKERRRPSKDTRDAKNTISMQNSTLVVNPMSNGKKLATAVTTCSPLPNRPCPHSAGQPHRRAPPPPASSSSASASPSSASDDDHHGNTSDFSDDDVTLNEMLGKFDESYVYEKETDILSDSDPTDCEDQPLSEDRASSNNLASSQMQEEFDFIDQGSLVELANSDSEFSNKVKLAGHCTYHHLPGETPEMNRKLTPRLRESARCQSAVRTRKPRKPKAKSKDSPLSDRRFRTYRKSSSQNLDKSNSCEAFLKMNSPLPLHRLENGATRHPGESPAKYMNLNRMLMERIMNNQRNGTRSADGTPVSLRKRGGPSKYNGKYMKNHNVSNLIDSDLNFNECRRSDQHVIQDEGKPRSGSLSVYSNPLANSSRTPCPPGLNELDKEGDLKYRQLIQEAEHIIEDLQVKSRAEYLSPTFRCKNGMERAKPSSPLVFSVPPSPLSLRYDVYRDGYETPPADRERSNNNCLFDRPIYSDQSTYALQKEKSNDSEEGLLRSISKTLERIIVRGTSDTNKKLDKSVSDPFAKGKKRFVLPAPPVYSNGTIETNCSLGNITPIGYGTPNLLRRSSSGTSNASLKLSTCYRSSSKLNQNDISNQGGFKKFFKKPDKLRNSSIEQLDKHNFPESGFCITTSNVEPERIYENSYVYKNMSKHDVHYAKYVEITNSVTDFSPNGNTPIYANGFQQIPWQHRTSQAERLKNLSDLQDSPKRKMNSPELKFERKAPLASFSSFDLGNKHVTSSRYCPQSEPVKRKIYKCSATFEKLQKSLLKKQPGIHPSKGTPKARCKEVNCSKLKLRVAQLKRETSADNADFPSQENEANHSLITHVMGTG